MEPLKDFLARVKVSRYMMFGEDMDRLIRIADAAREESELIRKNTDTLRLSPHRSTTATKMLDRAIARADRLEGATNG